MPNKKKWLLSGALLAALTIGGMMQWHIYTPGSTPMVDIPGAHILYASGGTYLLEVDLGTLRPHIVGGYRSSDDTWTLGDIDTLDMRDLSQNGTIRINGTFFGDVERLRSGETSRLAFPLWYEGRSSGYDGKSEGYGLRYLAWSRATGAQIHTSYPSQSGSELTITGLAPVSDKDGIGSRAVGRTYIGVISPYKLLILVAEYLSEIEAQDTLKKYGSIHEGWESISQKYEPYSTRDRVESDQHNQKNTLKNSL